MNKVQPTIKTILRAVALGLAVANLVLGILSVATVDTHITLIGLGLLALALAEIQN